jgi:hypothetical protein
MSTTDKILYGTSTAITVTLASLASSSTAGRSCAAVDNGTNLFDDALVTIAVKTSASALANDKACYIYVYGSEDGTAYDGSSAEAEGTNVAVTFDSPTNLKGPVVLACPASSVTYKTTFSVASMFGGVMPRKWGFVLQNYTGQALDSTEGNHQKTYTGINYQDV